MKKLIICMLALQAMVSIVTAQDKDGGRLWSLDDCFKYANEHNIQINTLRLNAQAAEQDLIAAKGTKTPSLYGTLTNAFTNANNSVSGDGHLVNQLTSSGAYSVNSSIVILNNNYINNTIDQRQLLIQSADLSVQQSLNNITLLITQEYLSILLGKENLKYITNLVSTSQARVKQGQQFYDAGSIAKKDLLQLQAQLASDQYLLVETQNQIRQSVLALKQNLQLPADVSFDIAQPDTVIVNKNLLSLNEVQQAALRDFPDSKIGKLQVDVASLDIAKANAGFKPTLSASGLLATGYSDVVTNAAASKTAYLKQTGNNFYQRAGVTLSIPIFSNYINKANRAKATIAYRAAMLNWQNDQLVLSQAVEQSYINAYNALQAYDAAAVQLQASSESYRISNEQFKLGAINSYDLLQQRNQYVQAVQAFTQAKYSAVLQQKIYEFYLGKPVTL
jgi:outer membrane protein